ncbi:MAG: hypothetical protein RBT76_10035 [candidate division Zixibacteria bacterium]|nr:hypothetical protein [candidate division Zixibacteria bacterium]
MRILISVLISLLILAASAHSRHPIVGARAAGGFGSASGELLGTADFGACAELGLRLTPAPVSSRELDVLLVGSLGGFAATASTKPDVRLLSAGAHLRLNLRPQSAPHLYLIGGGGFTHVSRSAYDLERRSASGDIVVRAVGERTETGPYLTAGAGIVVFSRPNVHVFIEARVVNVSGSIVKNYTYIPFMLGVGL